MKKISRDALLATLEGLKNDGFDYLEKITAVDYVDHLEVDYMLLDLGSGREEMLKVDLDNGDAWVPTVMHIFSGANWHEREMFEMFGINVVGRKIERLLIEKWDGVDPPLRKNFKWNQPYKSAD